MRKLLFFIPAVVTIYFSCNTSSTSSKPLSLLGPDSLTTENFTIDVDKDTLLHTINGAWLKIEKGTFSADNGKAIIEIKEAYSIQQIIKAGLVTQSNGQALSSGGMIYVNAAAGQKITINKPFKVAIPSTSLDKNMQLYKGEKTADSNINWKDPKAVDDNLQMNAVKEGEILFQQKCASCHGIGKEGSGPDLANVWKREQLFMGEGGYGGVWAHDFKKRYVSYSRRSYSAEGGDAAIYTDSFVHAAHPYICNLITLFNNQEVDLSKNIFAEDSDSSNSLLKIYRYIENESNRRNLPYPRHVYLDSCIDSCNLYNNIKYDLEKKKALEKDKRNKLVNDNGPLVDRKPDPTWGISNMPPPDFDKKVVPEYYPATYYQFTIETFGWYNVDMLMAKKDGVQDSELFVRVVGTFQEKIKIYLIIPSAKVLGEGGPSEKDKELYAFFYKSGFIPLPQNTKAYILAVTETENSVAYGLKEFTTQTKQELEISLHQSSKQEFDKAIESIEGDKLSITVKDSKNAAAIKEADKTIQQLEEDLKKAENIKPKRCDCDCGQPSAAPAEMPKKV